MLFTNNNAFIRTLPNTTNTKTSVACNACRPQIMGVQNTRAHSDKVFFIDTPHTIPEDHVIIYLMHGVKADKREAFAHLLAEANGGGNCFMPSASTGSSDLNKILANRKATIDAELNIPGGVYGQRVYHKKAQFM